MSDSASLSSADELGEPSATHREDRAEGPGWSLLVDPESDGERLDRFIAHRLPRVSRSRAARLTVYEVDSKGQLLKSGLKKSARVRSGQCLWVERPLPPEDLSTLSTPRVISRGNGLLILDKPAGWIAHPTASRYQSALTTWFKAQSIHATPVHRLDLETSGVNVCALSREAESSAHQLFLERAVKKRYLAICEVTPQGALYLGDVGDQWRDETSLGFDPQSVIRLKMGRGSLEAQTDFTLVMMSASGKRALIEARPLTGRQHQIRAHLSLRGLPIVGDKLYGPDESIFLRSLDGELTEDDLKALGHHRHALHATSLTMRWRGELHTWQSPLPDELLTLLNHDG